jgi:branched-chain amino acid transport system substrate-binding protein
MTPAQILGTGLTATKGDVSKKAEFAAAMREGQGRQPARRVQLSKAHNPVQDIYLRQVVGKENKVIGMASKA